MLQIVLCGKWGRAAGTIITFTAFPVSTLQNVYVKIRDPSTTINGYGCTVQPSCTRRPKKKLYVISFICITDFPSYSKFRVKGIYIAKQCDGLQFTSVTVCAV